MDFQRTIFLNEVKLLCHSCDTSTTFHDEIINIVVIQFLLKHHPYYNTNFKIYGADLSNTKSR